MAKAEQALTLDPPSELHFIGPFSEVTTTYLKLNNPTDKCIVFKVKTTAPKTYCVRPNGGVVFPKKNATVHVMLQPFDPDTEDRSKDKFMVQSMFVPEEHSDKYLEYSEKLWHNVSTEGLMNSKLKCIFYPTAEAEKVARNIAEAPKIKATPTVPETKESEPEKESLKLQLLSNKKLKAALSELRQQNSALKEEGIRSRLASAARTMGTSAKPFEPDSQQPTPKKQLSNYLIMISVFIFLLGMYIGKYIL